MTSPKRPHPSRSRATRASRREPIAEELLALAERAAKAGTWSWNIQSGEIYWSQGMYELFQLDPGQNEAGFDPWLDRLHPDDRERAQARIAEAIRDRSYLYNPYRIVLPDGEVRWIDAYGDLILDANGDPLRLSGYCIDATERLRIEAENVSLSRHVATLRQLEADLRLSQERLELALSGSGLALWDWDISAHKVQGGGHWREMFGYSPDEIDDHEEAWFALINPQDIPRFRSRLETCLDGETPIFESEHRLKHKDGHWVYVEARGKVSRRDCEGRPQRMVGTLLDISSRKRLGSEGVDLLQQIETLIAAATHGDARPPAKNVAVERLSRRQRQTLSMIANGMSSAEIANELKISKGTAIGHRRELMKKLDLHSAAEVARFAVRHKLVAD